jgi:hypothetical protein
VFLEIMIGRSLGREGSLGFLGVTVAVDVGCLIGLSDGLI